MAVATTLLGAIVQAFDNSDLADEVNFNLAGDATGLWVEEAAATVVTGPFLVLVHDGEVPEQYYTEKNYLERGRFHFEGYASALANAEALLSRVKAIFDVYIHDPRRLEITHTRIADFERGEYRVSVAPFLDQTGKKVYQATVAYSCLLTRDLP